MDGIVRHHAGRAWVWLYGSVRSAGSVCAPYAYRSSLCPATLASGSSHGCNTRRVHIPATNGRLSRAGRTASVRRADAYDGAHTGRHRSARLPRQWTTCYVRSQALVCSGAAAVWWQIQPRKAFPCVASGQVASAGPWSCSMASR